MTPEEKATALLDHGILLCSWHHHRAHDPTHHHQRDPDGTLHLHRRT